MSPMSFLSLSSIITIAVSLLQESSSFLKKILVREGAKIILRGGLLKSRTSPFENTYPPKNVNIGLDPP